ncbi:MULTISPECIES: pilus assembly FimT family protein [unclassified Vibrio]|uniref:pilus assembly FimT family protein n=1 Tax=unclassified Vibrio TaxID=2614977 RepID=UPI001E2C4129|nr:MULTISPECIES: hypothetical protein [unclassified Vibrio]
MTSKGFSIVEVLICCAVLSVTGHIAMLSVAGQLNNLKIKRATAQAHAILTTARDTAYGMKKDIWLHADLSSASGFFAIHHDNLLRNPQTIFTQAINPQQITEVSITTTFSSLRFSGVTGRPYGNGNISIGLNGETLVKVIYHDITGRIRICSSSAILFGYPAC